MGNDEIVPYKTSDIYFAAYLCAVDITLKKTEHEDENKKKVVFVFDVLKKDLQQHKTNFFGGGGQVKAQKFVQALRSLKSMCYV